MRALLIICLLTVFSYFIGDSLGSLELRRLTVSGLRPVPKAILIPRPCWRRRSRPPATADGPLISLGWSPDLTEANSQRQQMEIPSLPHDPTCISASCLDEKLTLVLLARPARMQTQKIHMASEPLPRCD